MALIWCTQWCQYVCCRPHRKIPSRQFIVSSSVLDGAPKETESGRMETQKEKNLKIEVTEKEKDRMLIMS